MTVWHEILIDPSDNLEHNNQPSYGKENKGGPHFNKNSIHGFSWAIVHRILHAAKTETAVVLEQWASFNPMELEHSFTWNTCLPV